MESLTQLREKLSEFEKLSVRLGCIVQGTAAEAAEICGQYGMAEKCIPDPEKESYAKLGLDRTTLGAMVFASDELKARRKENRAAGFSVSIKKSFMPHCDIFRKDFVAASRRASERFALSGGVVGSSA